ncbi:hypothetical protein JAAARDRAFT_511498 [Jaapia argillacea MUCL 33604]|uniref:SWI5-dependent HO expression protein 3 n=1 Tax=Jaapia argillacea MUCL 33604 TaxID=933084 RepID=A0A067Q3D9_9AGAM|nr:hypothetical protein JAAARDRAFT_511498 [Jaapia argillacea MUCL 33604]
MSSASALAAPFSPPRPSSRPTSRSSIRSGHEHSTSVTSDDPIAVRNHMSTLRHSIRQQQAQLIRLENEVLRGPRPLPPGIMGDPPHSPTDLATSTDMPPPSSFTNPSANWNHMRRTSHEALSELAGPDSNLPLPRKDRDSIIFRTDNGIPEGIPHDFRGNNIAGSPYVNRRIPSPTRSLSLASVGNARTLAEEGQHSFTRSVSLSPLSTPQDSSNSASPNGLGSSTSTLAPPPSPNKRMSLSATPGGTTRVLADLQAGVTSTRNALENTKQQLRQSQRQVAQLTRQTEDLKEGRERLRLEIDGLNAVVTRKERMLQEAVERARKAETEAASLKTQLKTETTTSKKSLREMESALTESTALSQKSQREYITLRDSIRGMVDGWKSDMEGLREEMRRREEKSRKEAEDVGKKYRLLLDDVKASQQQKETVKSLKVDDERIKKQLEDEFRAEIAKMAAEVKRSSQESEGSAKIARHLAEELARLRRLMQKPTVDSPSPTKQTLTPPSHP